MRSAILIVISMLWSLLNSKVIKKNETDPKLSFCNIEIYMLRKLGRLPKVPENVNTQYIPNDHHAVKELQENFEYLPKDIPDIDYIALFPTYVKNCDKKYTMTFNLSHLPEDLNADDIQFARITFFDYSRNSAGYTSYTPVEERADINIPEALSTVGGPRKSWLSISITDRLLKWYNDSNTLPNIIIECDLNRCLEDSRLTISTKKNELPYMMLKVKGSSSPARNLTIDYDDSEKCHKKSVHFGFADIEWDNWIIWPKNHTKFYCNGFCDQWMFSGGACAPSVTFPLAFIYWQGEALIGNIVPDMLVKECSCMLPKIV